MPPIKERQILFSGEMIRALLAGTKTQTRRIVKGAPSLVRWNPIVVAGRAGWEDEHGRPILSPYGQPGDRLWVSESWCDVNLYGAPGIAYQADGDIKDMMEDESFLCRDGSFNYDDKRVAGLHFAAWANDLISGIEGTWEPDTNMPRWASRFLLEITDVRVERLQDISEADALAEGVKRSQRAISSSAAVPCFWDYQRSQPDYRDARSSFSSLWESINGAGSGDANQWVWVIEFKKVEA